MRTIMTVVDYTLASIALVVFVCWLFGVFVIDSMKVRQ